MEYKIIRHHRRKNLLVTVSVTGEVIVKAPLYTNEKYIEAFVSGKENWIKKQQDIFAQKYHHRIVITKEERDVLKKQLLPQMNNLVENYSDLMGVKPKSVKITLADRRWGSCGKNGEICFSYRLALVSDRCREYLTVHELSHIKQFNHSKEFYAEIEKYLPDYKEIEKELNGYYIHLQK